MASTPNPIVQIIQNVAGAKMVVSQYAIKVKCVNDFLAPKCDAFTKFVNLSDYHCLHLSLFLTFRLGNFDKEWRRREKDSQIGLGTKISGKPTIKKPDEFIEDTVGTTPLWTLPNCNHNVCCKPEASGSSTVKNLKIMTKFISDWGGIYMP